MKRKWKIHSSSLAALLVLIGFPQASPAQALKGANWLRVDHNYNYVTLTDARRVGWNLEIAKDVGGMYSWSANYETLYNNYSIKTIFRIGWAGTLQPTTAERTALQQNTFSCSSITTLMNGLDNEANQVRTHGAVGPFILSNEPNLPNVPPNPEWGIDGRAYGRIYQCYRTLRWPTHRHGAKPLLAAVPGGCVDAVACSNFFTSMFAAMGSTVDGFAVHAYGRDSASFQSDLSRQTTAINQSANTAVRGKPVYVTEYNPAPDATGTLPIEPGQTYFDSLAAVVTNFNASNANQIKAFMYFVDSPDGWTRNGYMCHPSVPNPPQTGWWKTSLCYRDARRQAWLQAMPRQPLNASVSLSGLPFFMMPGQIQRFTANASNTGSTTWAGGGAGSMFRLGATGANGFVFSAFPQCGGYSVNTLNARVYTCNNVASGAANAYQVDARAPVSASAATFQVKMVQDGVTWFGNAPAQSVQIGQTFCGTALTQCILRARTDILPFYQGNGWNTSCPNRDAIVANWCGIDPGACNTLKAGTCAAFNNSCRCSGGIHLGGAVIDTNATFCGYQVCGTNNHIYSCSTGNVWTDTARFCN